MWRSNADETGSPVGVRIPQHKRNLTQALMGKSELANLLTKVARQSGKKAKIPQIEPYSKYTEHIESAHEASVINSIS
jgi:hypothetical protein